MTDLGTFTEIDGRAAVRFVRTYQHSVERVWSAVSTPGGLRGWFPSQVEIDLRPGGDVTFRADPHTEDRRGRVLACEPPHYLALTWGDDELRFHLEAIEGGGCRFTLYDLLERSDAAARQAAGWDVCLGELDKHLAGQFTDGPHSPTAKAWYPLFDAYVAAGLPAGAPIPSRPTTS
jgi:uncharacterized protein YndB with AHSA1/START domain